MSNIKYVPATLEETPRKKRESRFSFKIDNRPISNTPIDFSYQEMKSLDELPEHKPNNEKKMRRTLSDSLKRATGSPLDPNATVLPVTAVRLSYNNLTSISSLDKALAQLVTKPEELTWLDLSFNKLTCIDSVLAKFPKLTMLYLHGNNIRDLREVRRLSSLSNLKKLTLHGNRNVIDKGTRFLKMVRDKIKPKASRQDTEKALKLLPASKIREQCAMLKHFDISYDEGKKNAAIAKICNFIFADVTNKVYRPTAGLTTSAEDKKIIALEDVDQYRVKVIAALPNLAHLDFIGISPQEKVDAGRLRVARERREKRERKA